MNDLVALLRPHNLAAKVGVKKYQNAGDFRVHQGAGTASLTPHDTKANMALNFLISIRKDLGLSTDLKPEFLQRSSEIAESVIPIPKQTWLQWLDERF